MRSLLLLAAAILAAPVLAEPPTAAAQLTAAIAQYRAGAFVTARRAFVLLADRDSAVAETMLGTIYAKGQGVRADPATAATYYFRAAQRGYPPAQLAFAQALAGGHGIAADPDAAWIWARRAQQRGDPRTAAAAAVVLAGLAKDRTPAETADLDRRLDGWRPWATGRE